MADDTLRDRIADALVASWSVAEDPKSRAVARRAAERNADTVMAVVGDLQRSHDALAATVHAFPDANNAANITHARSQRDKAVAAIARVRAQHVKQDRPVKSWTLCDKHRRPPLNIPGRAEIEECAGCSCIDRWVCMHCNCPDDEWPCATIRALNGDGQASETADPNLETDLQERGISAGRKADPNIANDGRRSP